jgi:heat shock protein HslJ
MTKKIAVVFAILILTIFANVSLSAQSPLLGGRLWKLVSVEGEAINLDRATLEFDLAQGRFNGNSGCNRISGSVNAGKSSIRFSRVAMTRRACLSKDAASVEKRFSAALNRVRTYRVEGDDLVLIAGRTKVLSFTAAEELRPVADQVRLDEKKWMLESIGTNKLGKVEQQPFIVFDSGKGTAGGNTGCNIFSGSYTAKDSRIKIDKGISTMRACVEDRTDLEQRYTDALAEADRFDVKGNTLSLYKGNSLLLKFTGSRKD